MSKAVLISIRPKWVLAQIINGKAELIPFQDRYPDLKKIRYGR